MILLSIFSGRGERRRQSKVKKGICPDCSGRGFFSSGFEAVYVQDCDSCLGTGKAIRNE